MQKSASQEQDSSVNQGKKSQVSFFEDSSVTFRESKLKQRHPTENIFRVTAQNEDEEENISLVAGDVSKNNETFNTSYTTAKGDDDANQDKQLIDFEQLLKQQQEFTEASIPFTNHHIEDAIFIDDFHVIALEYIFFHNNDKDQEDPKYVSLSKKPAHETEDVSLEVPPKDDTNMAPRQTSLDGVNMFENPFEQLEDNNEDYLASFAKHKKGLRKSGVNTSRDQGITLKDLKNPPGKHCQFIGSNDPRVIVIPMLGKYHINEFGQIMKEDEIDIHFDCHFQPSKDMNMRLQLSHDRNRIVLPIVHQTTNNLTSVSLMMWNTHSLKPIKLSNEIKLKLQKLPKGKLIEANFIGVNEHLMITLRRETEDNQRSAYLEYHIFNSESGVCELKIDNKKTAVIKENIRQMMGNQLKKISTTKNDHSHKNSKIRFVGILPKPKASKFTLKKSTKKYKDTLATNKTLRQQRNDEGQRSSAQTGSLNTSGMVADFAERDLENPNSESDSLRTDSDEDIQNISNEIVDRNFLKCTNDLELCFIFISTDVHGTKEDMEQDDEFEQTSPRLASGRDVNPKEKMKYGEKIYWTKVNLSIIQIVKNGMEEQLKYIMSKAQDQFKKYTQDNYDFKQVPKSWFFDKDERDKNWEGEILISVNRTFKQFGFLNRSQKLFIVYDFKDEDEHDDLETQQDWLGVQNLPSTANDNAKVFLGRNQQTKEHIYLTVRIRGDGTTTYCFKNNGTKSKIHFNRDYENSIQDATHQNCNFKHDEENYEEEFIFSSITISRDDQEILMKTNRITETDKGVNTETLSRKTNSQYQQGMYPVFCYNIGLFKMIIQNTLGAGIQYVLELNQHEAFMSFVQFNTFKDIGFSPGDLDIAGNSHFAFLTFDGQTETFYLNLLFVDIYHEKCDFKLFKSTRVFGINDKKDKDIMMKAIVYSTEEKGEGNDYTIKLLVQYPNHFTQIEQMEQTKENQIKMFTTGAGTSPNDTKDEDDGDDQIEESLSSAPIVLDPDRGYIYYITEIAGQCRIYEILPTSDLKQNHLLVYEIKSENCFGFSQKDGTFLFIDNQKIITVLARMKESRKLIELMELNLKEKDSPNFLLDQNAQCIINEKYLIQKTKIFYLFGNKPLQTGLLDMEELAEPRFEEEDADQETPIPIKYVKGPYNFQEANEFGIIIKDENFKNEKGEQQTSYFFNMNIAKLPDGRFQQIITDFGKQVDLSTFLNDGEEEDKLRREQYQEYCDDQAKNGDDQDTFEDWSSGHGKILTKIANKWMLFDADCEFINRVNFYNQDKKPKEEGEEKEGKDTDIENSLEPQSNDDIQPEESEEDNFFEENKLSKEELENLNLHAMSENNNFYLFIKEQEVVRPSFGTFSAEKSFVFDDGSPRPRGSNRQNQKLKNTPSRDDASNAGDVSRNAPKCNQAGHKDMTPTYLQVFAMENTGRGDVMDMDLSGLKEYKKMFRRCFSVNMLEHPKIFEQEIESQGENENRQMYIDDDGQVNIIKTWQSQGDFMNIGKHDHNQTIISKIYAIKKSTSNKCGYAIESSTYKMVFEDCTLEAQKKAFTKLKKLFQVQIKNERKIQLDLPKNLKNNSKIEQLQWNIDTSDIKIQNVIKTFLFKNSYSGQMDENILICKCGKDIQVAKIQIGNESHAYEFKNIQTNFERDVEIVNILCTSVDNEIQIIARDEDKKCLIILTWDFDKNMETSTVQFPIEGDTRPGQHCVTGMKCKRNYFANDHYIYDLEFNIPIQNTENPIRYTAAGQKFRNQKKIFKNSSRSLSLNSESILKLAYNRMDLLYWKNIQELGEQPEIIIQNTELELFNQVFDGYSMFHYFVSQPEIIESVCKQYKFKKEQNTLNMKQEYVPLLILHLNNDGLSALDDAVNTHRPKSFKCMIDLITEVSSDFCLTKLMLNLLQLMIKQGTYMNHSFFDTTSFKPIMMLPALIVQWPEGMDDYAFASNTSLITKQQIEQKLLEEPHGLDKDTFIDESSETQKKIISVDKENDFDQQTGMKKRVLFNDSAQDGTFSRVTTEALDFDWLFEGENTYNFLELLSQGSQDDSAIYAKKSIKILIKLLWSKYKPKIKNKVLYPYLIYVFSFILLQPYIDIQLSEQYGFWFSIYFLGFKLALISCLYLYFVWFEIDQFIQDPAGYFLDAVNQADIAQYGLNAFIICMFIQDIYLDKKIMEDNWKKAFYAVACFLMWIKIYYMMRIFSQTAHFITLMTRIVQDVQTFTIMLMIIIFAFANFFYVIDMGDKDQNYVGLYTQNNIVNVLMEMYFVSLGNFNIGSYSNGENSGIIWIFFVLASFVIVVVFMNLLISIMGNTLGDVQAVQEQSQIQEQAEMIIEYFSLLKITEEFKNQKYVIYVSRDQNQTGNVEDDTQTIIMELKKALFDQLDSNQLEVIKRNEGIEKNIRMMSKQNNSVKNSIQQLSSELKRMKESIEKLANQNILESGRGRGSKSVTPRSQMRYN